ncbi:hypothetical protein POVWA2_047070 [Plasmodium ovale wallikeri]|uniref:Uncharacterized protein n=1 Tax=Plasmodium ovale wallikeri TaxID=864142 RepID=A0A1A8ZJI5_PLAOA|nr:hypothetical protein POVWA2_047070 [Plasmodium ovale wallikeri]
MHTSNCIHKHGYNMDAYVSTESKYLCLTPWGNCTGMVKNHVCRIVISQGRCANMWERRASACCAPKVEKKITWKYIKMSRNAAKCGEMRQNAVKRGVTRRNTAKHGKTRRNKCNRIYVGRIRTGGDAQGGTQEELFYATVKKEKNKKYFHKGYSFVSESQNG